jgi:hypothetical protein
MTDAIIRLEDGAAAGAAAETQTARIIYEVQDGWSSTENRGSSYHGI